MKRLLLIAATVGTVATPAIANDVGVRVGPAGAGVTVGAAPDHSRDRTVIKEREPRDRTTVIKKDNGDGTSRKTVIHDHD